MFCSLRQLQQIQVRFETTLNPSFGMRMMQARRQLATWEQLNLQINTIIEPAMVSIC